MSEVSPTGATASWEAPISHDDHKITHYEVGLIKDASNTETESKTEIFTTPSSSPGTKEQVFHNLVPGRYYGVKVRVVYSENGYGPWSDIVFFETKEQDVPSAPTKPKITDASRESVRLGWEAPANYRDGINEYEIEYGKKNTRPEPIVSTQGAISEYIINHLESGTTYTAKVRAIGKHRIVGLWSVQNGFTTGKQSFLLL